MKKEQVEVLRKIQNEEITAEEGAKLLDALENGEITESTKETKNGKILRVKVLSNDGDRVNIQIPLMFAKSVLKMGGGFFQSKMNSDIDIDLEMLLDLIDKGNIGKLVDIVSADGDSVEISID